MTIPVPRAGLDPGTPTDHDLSVGGTTGLSHEHSAAIDEAALWLATTAPAERRRPAVPLLRERFGLNAQDACIAIREARLILARAS